MRFAVVETPVGAIRFKIASRDGRVLNASPEFEDCAKAAAERGLPIKDVQAIATKAWLDARIWLTATCEPASPEPRTCEP